MVMRPGLERLGMRSASSIGRVGCLGAAPRLAIPDEGGVAEGFVGDLRSSIGAQV